MNQTKLLHLLFKAPEIKRSTAADETVAPQNGEELFQSSVETGHREAK